MFCWNFCIEYKEKQQSTSLDFLTLQFLDFQQSNKQILLTKGKRSILFTSSVHQSASNKKVIYQSTATKKFQRKMYEEA